MGWRIAPAEDGSGRPVVYGSTVPDLALALQLWEQMFFPAEGAVTSWDSRTVISNGKSRRRRCWPTCVTGPATS